MITAQRRILQRLFPARAAYRRRDRCGLVEQQHVGAGLEHLWQMHPVRSPPDNEPTSSAVGALEMNDEQ